MKATDYRHSCTIQQWLGIDDVTGLDEWVDVYSGRCLYQEQNNIYISGGMAQGSPMLYLPKNEVLFNKGYKCIITATKGRIIEAYIENITDYEGKIIKGTQIFLMQSRNE